MEEVEITKTAVVVSLAMLMVVVIIGSACGPPDSSPTAGPEGAYVGMRNTVFECYTFYSNGNVELRHRGEPAVDDSGSYKSGPNGGQINWQSGTAPSEVSTVAGGGEKLRIDNVDASRIQTCTP